MRNSPHPAYHRSVKLSCVRLTEDPANLCSLRKMRDPLPLKFSLSKDTVRRPYTEEVAAYCAPFHCDDRDLDDFFAKDAFFYDSELLGKTYAWLDASDPTQILGLITLANDSIKAHNITSSARNRLQRSVTNAKRGLNFPAVLIGRLGVAAAYQGKGMNIGSQIIDYVKDWFRSTNNKTGCRFIVVDAYNNERTLRFYERNGFKTLYKTEQEERDFLNLTKDDALETRFMFFDLKVR